MASSTDQGATTIIVHNKDSHSSNKRVTRRGSEWEILEGLKDGQRFDGKPEVYSGYLHKKRKWPLKGWHKRFFIVDKGILVYGKGPSEIARGKIHGKVDIGLSVISTKVKRKRLDIDADEYIHHLKAKRYELFCKWVDQLKVHRLYRQHVLTYGDRSEQNSVISLNKTTATQLILQVSENKKVGPPPLLRLSSWAINSDGTLDQVSKELTFVEKNLSQLTILLDQLEAASFVTDECIQLESCSPSVVKKDKRKFGLRRKKSTTGSGSWGGGNKGIVFDLGGSSNVAAVSSLQQLNSSPFKHNVTSDVTDCSPVSVCSLSGLTTTHQNGEALPISNSNANSKPIAFSAPSSTHDFHSESNRNNDFQPYNDFIVISKEINNSFRSVISKLTLEQERLKSLLESHTPTASAQSVITNLQNSLALSVQQNNELRSRLNTIRAASDISDLSELSIEPRSSLTLSSHVSVTDIFFDAQDRLSSHGADVDNEDVRSVPDTQGPMSDTSSEAGSISSEEYSISSENSECGTLEYNVPNHGKVVSNGVKNMTGRRMKLPCPRPDTEGLSLWNLLRRNIGKDLSQVSMPVALNEPLNMLQRLCEELEYSELLDKAAETEDPYERMVFVAAFAVSSYGSAYYRAGSKPFNPLLGETYECVREDKGFRFVGEQVSHHPPVSVCYAESKNFIFWQDIRIKTKFWGKSMEFQPIGYVNVKVLGSKSHDHYRWNKVTTCLHNLFADKRWADLYGELMITDLQSNITCNLTFVKASYWSNKRHEVYGSVMDKNGETVRNLFGKWNEALYCGNPPTARCIWRLGTMPENYELYYGFTRFAMELNELEPDMDKHLPITDTRFRPDQRLLEEGDLNGAEAKKQVLEQNQRERRKHHEESDTQHEPKWFRKTINENGEEVWLFTNKYWDARKNGFSSLKLEPLW